MPSALQKIGVAQQNESPLEYVLLKNLYLVLWVMKANNQLKVFSSRY